MPVIGVASGATSSRDPHHDPILADASVDDSKRGWHEEHRSADQRRELRSGCVQPRRTSRCSTNSYHGLPTRFACRARRRFRVAQKARMRRPSSRPWPMPLRPTKRRAGMAWWEVCWRQGV